MFSLTPEQELDLRGLMSAAPYREWWIVKYPDGRIEFYNSKRRAVNHARKETGSEVGHVQK